MPGYWPDPPKEPLTTNDTINMLIACAMSGGLGALITYAANIHN